MGGLFYTCSRYYYKECHPQEQRYRYSIGTELYAYWVTVQNQYGGYIIATLSIARNFQSMGMYPSQQQQSSTTTAKQQSSCEGYTEQQRQQYLHQYPSRRRSITAQQ